jgi:hypothetical protein
MQNLQSKTPYKFKKSYGGTPEPQTPQDAPWLRGPSLKKQSQNRSIQLYLQYYDTNLYICDYREIPNAAQQSSFGPLQGNKLGIYKNEY